MSEKEIEPSIEIKVSEKTYNMIQSLKEITLDEFKRELDEQRFSNLTAHFDEDIVISSAVNLVLQSAEKHIKGECGFHGNVRGNKETKRF